MAQSILLKCLLSVVVLSFCLSITAFAQSNTRVRGKITDASGAIIVNATVRLSTREGLLQTAGNNSDGLYEFGNLSGGDYVVEIEAESFAKRVEKIKINSGETREINVELSAAGVSEQVVVTDSGNPQTLDETAKSISVINSEDIERRDEFSFLEALRPLPGVRISRRGGPGSFSKIQIRGLRTSDTAVLLDGIRIRDAASIGGSAATGLLQNLFTTNIERIEVLRGSGSSLYGTNAVGGVINIIPKEGAGKPRFSVGFEGGGLGFFRERGEATGGLFSDKLGYNFAAERVDINGGVRGDEPFRNTSVGGRLHYNIRSDMNLRGTLIFSDSFRAQGDTPLPIGPVGNELGYITNRGPIVGFVPDESDPDSFRQSEFFVGSLAFTHQVNDTYNYSVSYQYLLSNSLFDNGPMRGATATRLRITSRTARQNFDGRINTFNFTNNIRLFGFNLLTVGIEAEKESRASDSVTPTTTTPRVIDRQSSVAFFIQDQVRFFDNRLQFLAAYRRQQYTLKNPGSFPQLQNIDIPRADIGDGAMSYFFRETGTKIRAHVGNSFVAPGLSQRFITFQGQRVGNPFLQPERGISVDGGVDQILFDNRLRLSGTYFYTKLQQIIVSTTLFTSTGVLLPPRNAPGALSRGAEFNLAASPFRGTGINAAYTFTNSQTILAAPTRRSDNIVLPLGASVQSYAIPRQMFSLVVNQQISRNINLNFDLTSVSDTNDVLLGPGFVPQVIFRFDGYTKADVGGSYRYDFNDKRSLTFYGKIDNVFNRLYFEEGYRQPRAVGILGVKFDF